VLKNIAGYYISNYWKCFHMFGNLKIIKILLYIIGIEILIKGRKKYEFHGKIHGEI